ARSAATRPGGLYQQPLIDVVQPEILRRPQLRTQRLLSRLAANGENPMSGRKPNPTISPAMPAGKSLLTIPPQLIAIAPSWAREADIRLGISVKSLGRPAVLV